MGACIGKRVEIAKQFGADEMILTDTLEEMAMRFRKGGVDHTL